MGKPPRTKKGPMMAALLLGAFVSLLNETLLNNAYPALMREFGIASSTVQWLSTGYMLVIGVLVPVTALLQQWFTTRQMVLSAMSLFLAGTVVGAAAPGFVPLLAGRVLQALGTGLLLPVLMTTILYLFPPERRGGAMGTIGLVVMFAPAIGPTLSGLVVDALSWRWLFYLVVPLAILSLVASAAYLGNFSERTRPKADPVSLMLSPIGFGGIVYGFSRAGEAGWADPATYGTLLIGGAAFLLFARRQFVLKEPLLELRAFRYPMFAKTMALLFLMMMIMFAFMILLPMYLQSVLLLSAFASGLAMMPGGILNGVLSPVSGKLFDRYGPRALILPGLALMALAAGLFASVGSGADAVAATLLYALLLTGFALAMMPAQTTGLNQLPRHLYPHATSIISTLQQVAGATGTALFVGILSSGASKYRDSSGSSADSSAAFLAGMQDAFAVGAILALAALVLGLFVKRGREPDSAEAARPGAALRGQPPESLEREPIR